LSREAKRPLALIALGVIVAIATVWIAWQFMPAPIGDVKKAGSQKKNKRIDYEVVKLRGNIVLITVKPKNRNARDMKALGKQLNRNYASEDFVRVSIYDNKNAAKLWDKIFNDTATEEETGFYDQHYIAQYNKNERTGLNRLSYFLEGPDGRTVIINY
jgi:hypothetical protein